MLTTLVALALPTVAAVQTAQSVCVYNDAAFVLKWHLHDKDHNKDSPDTANYPVWQTKCMSALAAGSGMAAGTALVPAVKAFWGKSLTPDEQVLYDAANATQITYVCRGTTLDYSCKQEAPPPTAADVVKDTGAFLLGFTEGLGAEVGFAKCLTDVNATYRDIVAVVDFFESGVNHKSLPAIVKAFEVVDPLLEWRPPASKRARGERAARCVRLSPSTKRDLPPCLSQLIGGLLKDFGDAITACVAEAKDLAAKLKTLASALSGNVLSIIKVSGSTWEEEPGGSRACVGGCVGLRRWLTRLVTPCNRLVTRPGGHRRSGARLSRAQRDYGRLQVDSYALARGRLQGRGGGGRRHCRHHSGRP